MKRIVFHIVLFLLATVLKAQDSSFTLGFKEGLDWSGLTGKDIEAFSYTGDYESLSGQMIGVYANNKLSKSFWLKHELSYARRFLNIQMNDGINPIFSSNIKRQYLDLFPANATVHFKGFQVYAGPYLGILLNASIQRKDTLGNLYVDKSFDNSTTSGTYAKRLDAGFIVGITYEFKVGLNIGSHYSRGFVPMIENGTQQNKVFNQFWGVSLGYSFIKMK